MRLNIVRHFVLLYKFPGRMREGQPCESLPRKIHHRNGLPGDRSDRLWDWACGDGREAKRMIHFLPALLLCAPPMAPAAPSLSARPSAQPRAVADRPARSADGPAPVFLSAETLRKLPHVHRVTVAPAVGKRKRQIIHVLNYHFVEREAFAADIRTEAEKAGETLTEADIDREWAGFLDDVEAVQVEQVALLRALVKSHGVKAVFLEGLDKSEIPAFNKLAGELHRWKKPRGDGPLDGLLI